MSRKWRQQSRQVRNAEQLQPEVAALAESEDLILEVRAVHTRNRQTTWHWMFNRKPDGKRILDYWPTNGKFRHPSTGQTGTVDPLSVVRLAVVYMGRYTK